MINPWLVVKTLVSKCSLRLNQYTHAMIKNTQHCRRPTAAVFVNDDEMHFYSRLCFLS